MVFFLKWYSRYHKAIKWPLENSSSIAFCGAPKPKIHRILFGGSLQIQFFEDAFGDETDDEHDGLPMEGDVQQILAFVDRALRL